jgi:hypothetical protein
MESFLTYSDYLRFNAFAVNPNRLVKNVMRDNKPKLGHHCLANILTLTASPIWETDL